MFVFTSTVFFRRGEAYHHHNDRLPLGRQCAFYRLHSSLSSTPASFRHSVALPATDCGTSSTSMTHFKSSRGPPVYSACLWWERMRDASAEKSTRLLTDGNRKRGRGRQRNRTVQSVAEAVTYTRRNRTSFRRLVIAEVTGHDNSCAWKRVVKSHREWAVEHIVVSCRYCCCCSCRSCAVWSGGLSTYLRQFRRDPAAWWLQPYGWCCCLCLPLWQYSSSSTACCNRPALPLRRLLHVCPRSLTVLPRNTRPQAQTLSAGPRHCMPPLTQ